MIAMAGICRPATKGVPGGTPFVLGQTPLPTRHFTGWK